MRLRSPLVATLAGTVLFIVLYAAGSELYRHACIGSAWVLCDVVYSLLVVIVPASAGYTAGRLHGRHGVWYGALAGLAGVAASALIDSLLFPVPFIFASIGDIPVWLSNAVAQAVALSFFAGGVGELRSRVVGNDEF